jgi:signal transduction histidine kinase
MGPVPKGRFPVWTAVLLALAGVAIVPVGWRAARVERDETDLRVREALVGGARRAARAAESPDTPPEETWDLVPSATPRPDALGDDLVLLQHADFLERGSDPEAAERVYARLASRGDGAPATRVAALRAGAAAARRGDVATAQARLVEAEGAPADLADDAGLPVALLARYHRARLGIDRGEVADGAVGAFLETAGDGRRLAAGDGPGPDDLVLALAARAGDAAGPALRRAAERVRTGRRALASRLPAAVEGRLFRRSGATLEARPLASLVAADDAPPGVRFAVLPRGAAPPAGARTEDLPPPLDGLVLAATPTRSPRTAVLVFAAAFAVYLAGAGLAVAAIRRSERAARMQADFVAAVSHEMKTPIASVRAMAEMLSDGAAEDPERARVYAERIEREMRRLGASVRNVLDAARIERTEEVPLSRRPAEPLRVVEDAVAAVLPSLEGRGFRVVTTGRPLGRALALDPDALHGVLANLLDNAAKYSGEAREIAVEAGPSPAAGTYRIAVLDRGIGVPPEERPRLFRRFFRGAAAKRAAIPGVGLGLHVAREAVRAHGGDLVAEARDGGGSAFVVTLPLEPGA